MTILQAGCTSLNIASQVGQRDVVKVLLEHGADPSIAETVRITTTCDMHHYCLNIIVFACDYRYLG